MTRFARAKGSKSSNEKFPEEATTWQEMKDQLELKKKEIEDSKKRKEFENKRQENYSKFVETVENEKANNTIWSEFPRETKKSRSPKSVQRTLQKVDDIESPKKVSKEHEGVLTLKKNVKRKVKDDSEAPEEASAIVLATKTKKKNLKKKKVENDAPEEVSAKVPATKNKKTKGKNKVEDDDAPEEMSAKVVKVPAIKTKKNKIPKSKPLVIPKVEEETQETATKSKKKDWSHLSEEAIQQRMVKKREKRQKRSAKMREKKQLLAEANGEPTKEIKNSKKELGNVKEKKKQPTEANVEPTKSSTKKLTRKDKIEQKVDFKRRKPESNIQEMDINGQKVQIVKVGGYPLRKDDADRLAQLKKKMISKGIPRSEVERTLKLERRKCEKALARLKKVLCFNCRKSGHNLSECPQLENNQTTATGICFKCGSTEHTHFECKVVRSMDFKYAQCFICKEQGHIARQCPENPRGLYPNGGACKLCGDVTHFKKDCPTMQTENNEDKNTISLGILDDSASLEGLGDENKKRPAAETKQKVKRIKF